MPNFDGDSLVITLDSGITEIDVQDDIYEQWKDWMLSSSANRKYPAAFRSDGGNPLSSIINQGSYFFLNNTSGWRIKPPEEDITIYLTGNLAVEDTVLPAFIATTGDYTAAILGLQPITQGVTPSMQEQLEFSSYGGGVTIDVTSPFTGLLYPIGTAQQPVNNLQDAHDISFERGFTSFYVLGDLTIDVGTIDFQGDIFIGESQSKSTITIDPAADVNRAEFYNAHIQGTLDGNAKLQDCLIDNLNYINGYVEQCVLAPGTILLGGSETAHFLDCWSGVPGTGTPEIDMGGTGQSLAIRNYNGGISLKNKTGPESVSLDINSGQVVLQNTVTNGTIVARGVGKLIDENGDHIQTGTWSGVTIVNEMVSTKEMVKEVWGAQTVDHNQSGTFGDKIGKKLLTTAKYLGLK